ncbi:MAG: FecR protein, partial [Hymenobacter sp.]
MQGSMAFHTPNTTLSVQRLGAYRIDYDAVAMQTKVTVREGLVQLSCGPRQLEAQAGQTATLSGSPCTASLAEAAPADSFDAWCSERDRRDAQPKSLNYVSRGMVGYEDLDDYGAWQTDTQYGAMWMPSGMPSGWAPYHVGHWVYVLPWGWTWVDAAPWGFAPFHYGRWVYAGNGWGWLPGGMVARPYYAPALVAFVGGGVGVAAWFALGPGDVYSPAYPFSPIYGRRINAWRGPGVPVAYGHGPYLNRGVPGAIVVVPVATLQGGRPVGPGVYRPVPAAMRGAPVAGFAPSVAPHPALIRGYAGRTPSALRPGGLGPRQAVPP